MEKSRLPIKLSKNYLKLIPLGGLSGVTKNLFVYETENDILIVDCGVGFPEEGMYGVDLVIPDVSYLENKKRKIRGIILTHGHEDHMGALPYILPKLNCPVYASKLTAALSEVKLSEFGIKNKIKIISPEEILNLGDFSVSFIHVTHSIPDSNHLVIKTPIGSLYHGSDFKFDWTPADGKFPEVQRIALAGKRGILCLLSDCLRVEKEGYTLSESAIEDSFEKEIKNCLGKFIVTTYSSNISRIQQAINVALRHNRKICFLGRSMKQSTEVARRLGFLSYPNQNIIKEKELKKYPDKTLALIAAGSQGQIDSALSRIAASENKNVQIREGDVVVFSADPIPGNENAVHSLINALVELGAKVSYSEVLEDLHVSGHGSQSDLSLLIGLTRPKYLIPIGGELRQMRRYKELATSMGYTFKQTLLLKEGQVVVFDSYGNVRLEKRIESKTVLVDGLGIGDVGSIVLRDRKKMAAEGVVVVILPVEKSTGRLTGEPDIISRGFVYMKEQEELLEKAKNVIRSAIRLKRGQFFDRLIIKKRVEEALEKFFFKKIKRHPMILPIVIET